MTTILDLGGDMTQHVIDQLTGPMYWWTNSLTSVPLTCRAWLDVGRRTLAKEHVHKRHYTVGLRLVRIWQKLSVPVFVRLWTDGPPQHFFSGPRPDLQFDLNAVDVPGTLAHFASTLFALAHGPEANREFRTDKAHSHARFQIRDDEAMNTFLATVQHDMTRIMEKALLYVCIHASNAEAPVGLDCKNVPIVRGADLYSAIISLDNPQPSDAFMGNLQWEQHAPPPTNYRAPDVGVSLDAQLAIVSALARRAGIPKFDGSFTKLAWWVLIRRASQLIAFASLIATSGLDPNGHAPQFDDDELPDSGGGSNAFVYDSDDSSDSDYEPEDDDESDSCSTHGTNSDFSDDEPDEPKKEKSQSRDMVDFAKERAAKRRRTCRFDPVLHDGENIPEEWHFKTHHYVISPSAKCFRWAYERM